MVIAWWSWFSIPSCFFAMSDVVADSQNSTFAEPKVWNAQGSEKDFFRARRCSKEGACTHTGETSFHSRSVPPTFTPTPERSAPHNYSPTLKPFNSSSSSPFSSSNVQAKRCPWLTMVHALQCGFGPPKSRAYSACREVKVTKSKKAGVRETTTYPFVRQPKPQR
jgi:hypothetical protein